jgi:hypothetical protein
MFPAISYVKIGASILLILSAFAYGWHVRNVDYMAFKKEVEATAKTQEAKVESIQKQHELVTKGIQNEYDAKLNTLRNYYKSTSVWNNNGSSSMSGISPAPKSIDVISAYNELAGQCAQTTLQLIELQKWINEQMGIK